MNAAGKFRSKRLEKAVTKLTKPRRSLLVVPCMYLAIPQSWHFNRSIHRGRPIGNYRVACAFRRGIDKARSYACQPPFRINARPGTNFRSVRAVGLLLSCRESSPFFRGPVGALQRGTFSPMDSLGIWGHTCCACCKISKQRLKN